MNHCAEKWPDGTKKSTANAFQWKDQPQSLFTKKQLLNATNAGRPSNYPGQVIAYSKAKPKK